MNALLGSEEEITSKLTDLTLRSKNMSITTLLNSTAGKKRILYCLNKYSYRKLK